MDRGFWLEGRSGPKRIRGNRSPVDLGARSAQKCDASDDPSVSFFIACVRKSLGYTGTIRVEETD